MKPSDYFRTVGSDKASLYSSFYDLEIPSLLVEEDSIRVLEIGTYTWNIGNCDKRQKINLLVKAKF